MSFEFNWRGFAECMLIALICIAFLWLITPGARAEETVIALSPPDLGYGMPLNYTPVISQGDTVHVNDTVDISRVTGWAGPDGNYRIAYYGMWMTDYSPGGTEPVVIYKLPGKTRSGRVASQYKFYMDPAMFADYPGWWYQFVSNSSSTLRDERAGNLRAFYVDNKKRGVTFRNNTSDFYIPGNYTEPKKPIEPLLPEKAVSDYIVARGDAPDILVAGSHAWVFGRLYGLYGLDRNLTIDDIHSLENGNYRVVLQYPGPNTIYEVNYKDDELIPGLYGQKPVDVSGMSAYVIGERFDMMAEESDDDLRTYEMVVEDPYITLDRADEIYLNGITVMDIRGYTNAANGTEITITLDEGRTYKKYVAARTVTTEAVQYHSGNLSCYRAYLPVDYDSLSAANAMNHTITARTALGGAVYKDFWISVMPEDSFKPNATLKYIEGRNPWVPTPTPEIVTVVQTKVVPTYITVKETPKPEEITAAAEQVVKAQNERLLETSLMIIIGAGICLFVFWFGYSVYRARRERK